MSDITPNSPDIPEISEDKGRNMHSPLGIPSLTSSRRYSPDISEYEMSISEYENLQRLMSQRHKRIINDPITIPQERTPSLDFSDIDEDERKLRKSFYMLYAEQQKEIDRLQSASPDDENSQSSSKSDGIKENDQGLLTKKPSEKSSKDIGDITSSINSNSTAATIRGYSSINDALKEKYVPSYIEKMKIFFTVIIISLIALSSI